MCGRFTQIYTWAELHRMMDFLNAPPRGESSRNLQPRYNVAPTTTIDVIVLRDGKMELVPMRWGLVPSWWKKTVKEVPATFNARAESVRDKPMFRGAFKQRRCLIPASGFYEWTGPKTDRQPHYITSSTEPVLMMAGLWESWIPPGESEPIQSATIIVTSANRFMGEIHDRMPVFVEPRDYEAWLSGQSGEEVLQPAREDFLQQWNVSQRVNKSGQGNNDPTLIEPI